MFFGRMVWRSLRRTPGVTVVMIIALSLGIGTWYTQRQTFTFMAAKEPAASPDVFHIALERGALVTTPTRPQLVGPLLPALLLTPHDARGVLAGATTRHTMTFGASALLELDGRSPETVRVRYATPALFPLFEIPLVAGAPWAANTSAEGVIDELVARRLFGSASTALGRTVSIDGAPIRIVGVVGARHRDRYHLYERFVSTPVAFYLHLARGHDVQADFRHVVAGGESGTTSAWIELPTVETLLAFAASANAYLARERASGRGATPTAITLRSVHAMRRMFTPGGTMNLWPLLTAMCLVTCIVNLIRMLMVKFAGRHHDLGLLRAFGARRRGIMGQLLFEALLIGLVAGIGGVVVGVAMMPLALTTIAATAAGVSGTPTVIDLGSVVTTVGAAMLASLIAALYPAWVLSRGTPASQLGRG